MSTSQNSTKANIFIDYVPAELRENKTWEIVYYAKNPFTNELQIRRNRVRPLKSIAERRKLGKRMCEDVNQKLRSGWTPFINSENAKSFARFSEISQTYLNQIIQKVKKKELSIDTLRSYKSFLNNIDLFFTDQGYEQLFMHQFKEELIRDFLVDIYYDRDNTARTHNNYLRFINTFSKWLLKRKYITVNPTININLERESEKKREYIPLAVRQQIFGEIKKEDVNFLVICLTGFYCLIRRTELTKLKVEDVILKNSIIYIESGKSKNRKNLPVTIPNQLLPYLIEHLKKANNSDYLFSAAKFLPGKEQLKPKKISDTWSKYRRVLKLPTKYQWYALKDTGITNYLELGLPTITVKNQARHHSITQTEAYIPKRILRAVEKIQDANISF